MARRPRDDAPGALHHVMVRGIERRSIFLDDTDREDLLRRLSHLVPELGFRCFAWALMPNHLHLVVRSGNARISQLMARLGTGYARRFNERHDRVGHLFQNRFRSRLASDDADLMGLVLYVTRNPLEAGLVADATELERFPWCGLGALVGLRPPHAFEAVAETLDLFGDDPAGAREQLRSQLGSGGDPCVALRPADPPPPHAPEMSLDDVLHDACLRFGVSVEDIRSRRRNRRIAAARAAVAMGAIAQVGLTAAEVARRLGVTKAAVYWMLERERRPTT